MSDLALYRAKNESRGTYRFFEPGMDARLRERRELEADLRVAIREGQFEVHYQPLLDLATNAIGGFEALGPLAPPCARAGPADRLHSDRRGHQPDHPDRRVGPAPGLPRRRRVARRREGRGQPLAGPVQARRPDRRDHERAGVGRSRRPNGSSSRSPNPCCCTTRRGSARCSTGSTRSACGSRSTISAPAIRA